MSRWQITLLLAGWEFRRFFKWKSQIIAWVVVLLLMTGLAVAGPRIFRKTLEETTVVGVVGETPFSLPPALGVTWQPGDEESLRAAYAGRKVEALLTFQSDSEGTLESRSEGGWVLALQGALDTARRAARLAAHSLDPKVLRDVTAPFTLDHKTGANEEDSEESVTKEASRSRPSTWDKIFALSLLGFMFGGIFSGTALLFTGITSEKQHLVTEQIVAAVPPQTWIDGKILGTGFRALTGTLELVLWSLLGMLILLPFLAPVLALPAYFHPDGGLALLLSLLPPTATMALSVRLALTSVPAWQVFVAVAGMVITTALLRRAAGKVFAMAILLRGTEPGWREIWRAARRG